MVRNVRWSITAHHNQPILREVSRKHGRSFKTLLTPVAHRNRIQLWIITAGMLDAARYMNVPHTGTNVTSHDEEVYGELSNYIMVNYKKDMHRFRHAFNEDTNNFAKDKEIKQALYEVIMSLSKSRVRDVSPFWVLQKGLKRYLRENHSSDRFANS